MGGARSLSVLLAISTVVDALGSCVGEHVAAGLPDLTAAFMFVVGGDAVDGGGQSHVVVVGLDAGEFGVEFGGVERVGPPGRRGSRSASVSRLARTRLPEDPP